MWPKYTTCWYLQMLSNCVPRWWSLCLSNQCMFPFNPVNPLRVCEVAERASLRQPRHCSPSTLLRSNWRNKCSVQSGAPQLTGMLILDWCGKNEFLKNTQGDLRRINARSRILKRGGAEEGEAPLKASAHYVWVTAGSVVNHQIHMSGLQEEK